MVFEDDVALGIAMAEAAVVAFCALCIVFINGLEVAIGTCVGAVPPPDKASLDCANETMGN